MTAFSVHRHLPTARFLKNNFSYENKMTATFANERKTLSFFPRQNTNKKRKEKPTFHTCMKKPSRRRKKLSLR